MLGYTRDPNHRDFAWEFRGKELVFRVYGWASAIRIGALGMPCESYMDHEGRFLHGGTTRV